MITLKACGNSKTQKLAGAIAANLREQDEIYISSVGASALNQAIKSLIVARRFLMSDKEKSDLVVQPEFSIQTFDEEQAEGKNREVTAIKLHVKKIPYDPSVADAFLNAENNK